MTDEERYAFGLMVEEMGEALQLIGKAMRFGIDTPGIKRADGSVDMAKTPRTMLPVELGDVVAAINYAARTQHLFKIDDVLDAALRKFERLTDPEAKDNLGRPLAPL